MGGLQLVDDLLSRVVTLPINFYSKGEDVIFTCNLYNSVAQDIVNVCISTGPGWDGYVSVRVTGGDWQPVTSDYSTTCVVGTIIVGGLVPISVKVNIPISAGISGSSIIPLNIARVELSNAE